MTHARVYYRLPSGAPSSEVSEIPRSWRELLALYGDQPVNDLDRRALKRARQAMIDAGLSRGVINQRVGRVKHALRWLAEEELIPDAVAAACGLLRPLPAFRSEARETDDVRPVDASHVAATLARLREPWASMVRLQWHTGMRPGEVCGLRVAQVAPLGRQLLAVDFGRAHKMAYKGKGRRVILGPAAVAAVARPLFTALAYGRDTVFVCPRTGRAPTAKHYGNRVARCALAAGVPHWHPNQLRHSHGTRVRRAFGLDAAQVALGHAKADVTQVYAEADHALAERVAREMG